MTGLWDQEENTLTIRGSSNSFGVPYERGAEDEAPTVQELVDFGEDTFESILKYMVSSGLAATPAGGRPKDSVLKLLYLSGLMTDL